MKAAVLEELNKMVVKEVSESEVGKGDVLVRIKACAIESSLTFVITSQVLDLIMEEDLQNIL